MTLAELNNLVKIKQLKEESPDQAEFNGLVNSAKNKLQDSRIKNLSDDSRFLLAYSAAHALALAALRASAPCSSCVHAPQSPSLFPRGP